MTEPGNHQSKSLLELISSLILAVMTLFLVLIALFSIRWRILHDTPILLYIGYLIDHYHMVPYKDIFDFNMPGTYLINIIIGRLTGYQDIGIRIIDLIYLIAISITTWFWFKKIDSKSALYAIVAFGLLYLCYGPYLSLQREYYLLLPFSLAILVTFPNPDTRQELKSILVGILFGICFTIKPQSIIGYPWILLYLTSNLFLPEQKESFWKPHHKLLILSSLIGFIIPLLMMIIYLIKTDSLSSFWDIVIHYWPLYGNLTRDHQTISGLSRIVYWIKEMILLGSHYLWIIPAIMGVYVCLGRNILTGKQKREVIFVIGFCIIYGIYPILSGQFWLYHWLPFLYFITLLGSLSLLSLRTDLKFIDKTGIILIFVLVILFRTQFPIFFARQMLENEMEKEKYTRINEITKFLENNISPKDTVQPLDWTGGAVHAMLSTKAKIATPFVYDFHFYHHINNPYIQSLRKKFIRELEKSPPKFIIEVISADKPWVKGENTTQKFNELKNLLNSHYSITKETKDYHIYIYKHPN